MSTIKQTPTLDVATELHKFLPKSMEMPNGDVITPFDWWDGDPPENANVSYPYGVFAFVSGPPFEIPRYGGEELRLVDELAEEHTFDAETLVYFLDVPDIASVTEIRATVGGTPGIVIPLGEVSVQSLNAQGTNLDGIVFLGPTFPDDGTTFEVDYKSREVAPMVRSRGRVIYRLTLHARDLPSGTMGASVQYDKVRLINFLGEALWRHCTIGRGSKLAGDDAELIVGDTQVMGRLPVDPGEDVMRYTLDLELKRHVNHRTEPFAPLIQKQDVDTTANP